MPLEYSVVIPTYAGRRYLAPCLNSVFRQSRPAREIIVVDDASPDSVDSWIGDVATADRGLRVLRNERNLGFAGAANRGVAASSAPIVALLNDDTEVDPHWARSALQNFAEPRVGSVATRIVFMKDPGQLDSAGDLYTVGGGAIKFKHGRPVWEAGARRETFSACAAAAFYRRKALEELGAFQDPPFVAGLRAFDEGLESYYEDVDLGFRLRLAGWRCHYEARAMCRHNVSSSYGASSWRYHFRSSRNAEVVFWSDMPADLLWRYMPAHLLFLAVQSAKKLFVDRQLLAWLSGKAAFLGALPRVRARRSVIQSRRTASSDRIREALHGMLP